MELIKDIKAIAGDNCEVAFEFNPCELTIWISNEVILSDDNVSAIPITFGIEEFGYLNIPKYFKESDYACAKELKDVDFGFDWDEIKIIHNIFEYIRENKQYIRDLLNGLNMKDEE